MSKVKSYNKNYFSKCNGKETYTITYEETFSYNSLLEISIENRNYNTITRIGYFLNKIGKPWIWLVDEGVFSESTLNTYLSGRENISLLSIEKIISVFNGVIWSPRKIINLDNPVLKGGKSFELNIKNIMVKYRINRGDLSLATGIHTGSISTYFTGVTKQIRIETLHKFYHYFKSQGVPLRNLADLIYFPEHGEVPLHFLSQKINRKLIKKYNLGIR